VLTATSFGVLNAHAAIPAITLAARPTHTTMFLDLIHHAP